MVTESQLIKQGFNLNKSYPHDQFYTYNYKKGCLEYEITYEGEMVVSSDLTIKIDESEFFNVDNCQLEMLDTILNKNQ